MNQQEKEAQKLMIEVCRNIVLNFADQYKVDQLNLNIRIDMENTAASPVFGVFDKTGEAFRFLARHTLQEIIAIGASDMPPMFRKMLVTPVRDTISEMFKQAMKGYDVEDSKQVFILLHLQQGEKDTEPAISIYHNNEKKDSAVIGQGIGTNNV